MIGIRSQPQGLLRLNQVGLSRSISLLYLPGVNAKFDVATKSHGSVIGTNKVIGAGGLEAGFGSARGKSNTDRIETPLSNPFPGVRTYFVRAKRNGPGGVNVGRLFDKSIGTTGQMAYYDANVSSLTYHFFADNAERLVRVPNSSVDAAVGKTFDFVVCHTYNEGVSIVSTYVNGVFAATQRINGTLTDAPSTPLSIGNRGDGVRCWDGTISQVATWDRELSPDEIKGLTANPWDMFLEGRDEYDWEVVKSLLYIDTTGSAIGTSTSYSTSKTVTVSKGYSTGGSTVNATGRTVFGVKGASEGNSIAASEANSIYHVVARAVGNSSAQSMAVSLVSTEGRVIATSEVSGHSACVWQVVGTSTGSCIVQAEGWYEEGGKLVFFDTDGQSYGSSFAASSVQSVTEAKGFSRGTSTAVGAGQALVSAIGSCLAASVVNATGISVISATGVSAGTSAANCLSIAIHNVVARSLTTSEVSAIAQSVVSASGGSKGHANVSGVTTGGVHYLAEWDSYNITLMFSPYAIEYNGDRLSIDKTNEFTIKRN